MMDIIQSLLDTVRGKKEDKKKKKDENKGSVQPKDLVPAGGRKRQLDEEIDRAS